MNKFVDMRTDAQKKTYRKLDYKGPYDVGLYNKLMATLNVGDASLSLEHDAKRDKPVIKYIGPYNDELFIIMKEFIKTKGEGKDRVRVIII